MLSVTSCFYGIIAGICKNCSILFPEGYPFFARPNSWFNYWHVNKEDIARYAGICKPANQATNLSVT